MKPTDKQLRAAAQHTYGTSCSQIFCKAGGGLSGGDRGLSLPDDLHAERVDLDEGTWITAKIWISDDSLDEGDEDEDEAEDEILLRTFGPVHQNGNRSWEGCADQTCGRLPECAGNEAFMQRHPKVR